MEELNVEACCADADCTLDTIIDGIKRHQMSEFNKKRVVVGEYYRLFPTIKNYEEKFKLYTRMKLETFEYIVTKVKDKLLKNWCNLHQNPIQPEEKLVVTLRFLAVGASYSDLAFTFAMGKSTICYLIDDVLNVLWTNLVNIHMPVPTSDHFMDIAQQFYLLWDLPHCVGAIDVKHIRIKKPSNSGSVYFNYKKYFSITLQALVDANYKFVVIDVGGYGHQHDATTFRFSKLYKGLQTRKLQFLEEDELFNSDEILPYFMIGDGAYPLSKNLLKPYRGLNLSEEQKMFNKRLSKARVTVECAFGHVCQKWRIFYKTIEEPPTKVESIVKAACILHNLIINLEKPNTAISSPFISETSEENEYDGNLLNGDGETVRKQLIKFFIENPL